MALKGNLYMHSGVEVTRIQKFDCIWKYIRSEGYKVDMKRFWLKSCLTLLIDESCKDRKSSPHTYCYLVKFPSCLVSYVCKLYTKFQKKTCLRSYLKFLPGNIKVCNSSGSLILNTCAREFITWKDREKFARNILSGSNKILDDGSPEV